MLVEPGPFETSFFDKMKEASNPEQKVAYAHVDKFFGEFVESLKEMFASDEAPTDAKMVVDAFAELIATPKGQRPLRRIVGIDFSVQELNDVTEPVRKAGLEAAGLADWDGAQG